MSERTEAEVILEEMLDALKGSMDAIEVGIKNTFLPTKILRRAQDAIRSGERYIRRKAP